MNLEIETIDSRVIARSFSQAALSYDTHAALQRRVVEALIDRVPRDIPVSRILNVGSGTGYCSDHLRALFPSVQLISLDIAEGMLRFHARRSGEQAGVLVCADAAALPFRQGCVDLVFSSLALQWSADLARVFSQLNAVCRPGAVVAISTLIPPTLHEVASLWAGIDSFTHVNHFMPEQQVLEAAQAAGLEIIDSHRLSCPRRHDSLQSLSAEMKGLGARNLNPGKGRGLTGKNKYRRLLAGFDAACVNGVFETTFEVSLLVFASRRAEP